MRSLSIYTYMIPVGLSTSASTLIGISIGLEDKKAIIHYFKVLMASAGFTGLVQAVILYFSKTVILMFFTKDDPDVCK